MKSFISLALAAVASGTILWDGRFNDLSSSSDLLNWSWSNQVGPYQYYIHGSSDVTSYVNLGQDFKNPADTGSNQGVKITLDSTAYWNGQTMRRTELIPQTSAAINSGKVWYHFSMMRKDTNAPSVNREHQIAFFESHFTEMKAGWLSGASGTSNTNLSWCIGGSPKWAVEWQADVWHNIAYEIDFSASTVAFYHSTGANDLALTVSATSASTSSNGADWHLGVLELPRDGYSDSNEDIYFSGVYVESGSLTTSVSGPGGSSSGGSSSSSSRSSTTATSTKASTSTTLATSTTSAGSTTKVSTTTSTTSTKTSSAPTSSSTCTAAKWAQCAGIGYTGCTTCVSGTTCQYNNDWYSQCL